MILKLYFCNLEIQRTMKKVILLSTLLCAFGLKGQQVHIVTKGDTAYNISKKYGMTLEEFARMNPNIKDGQIRLGDHLKVKSSMVNQNKPSENQEVGYIVLQPKQTIYGITRQYRISEAELRRLNPNLESNMKIGYHLALPQHLIDKYAQGQPTVSKTELKIQQEKKKETVTEAPETETQNLDKYLVRARDNYYKISKKFGLTQKQLFELNPGLEDRGLKEGDWLNVKVENSTLTKNEVKPSISNALSKSVQNDDYVTYMVNSGDTVFGILNRFDISLDQLLSLNPELASGLKVGMVLRIRKLDAQYIKKNGDALNVVIMLPFGFDTNDSRYRQLSADFLTGAKLAIERNAAKGQKLDINVVDAGNEESFKKNLTQINKNNTDLIIGPLFKSNIVEVLDYVGDTKIPVVAPFANSEELYEYSNLIIAETSDKYYADKIVEETAKIYNGQKIYVISGEETKQAEEIKKDLQKQIKNTNVSIVRTSAEVQIEQNMMTGQAAPVIAILASKDEKEGEAFAQKMISLSKNVQGMRAFSMYYNPTFEKHVDPLSQVHLVYLMDRKINSEGSFEREVLEEYKKKYCKSPSKYAVIGFDIVNDILSRENKSGEVFKQIFKVQTQLATKFEYVRAKKNGAYVNAGFRVVRLVP